MYACDSFMALVDSRPILLDAIFISIMVSSRVGFGACGVDDPIDNLLFIYTQLTTLINITPTLVVYLNHIILTIKYSQYSIIQYSQHSTTTKYGNT